MPGVSVGAASGLKPRGDDLVQPFLLEIPGIRGRLVRLGPLLDEIVGRHGYPEPVASLLAEFLALATALASLLKYNGIFTLQARGEGPLRLLVADITDKGATRGYAAFDADRLPPANAPLNLPSVMGPGYLSFTVDPDAEGERYQGIVALEGASLADCVLHYFRQSEQLPTGLLLAAGGPAPGANKGRRVATLILQRLPQEGETARGSESEEAWRRAMVLMASCRQDELVGPRLSSHQLLYRLFHEERVRVFRQRRFHFACRCTRERLATVLKSLPQQELLALAVEDEVTADCQFCGRKYRFSTREIAELTAP